MFKKTRKKLKRLSIILNFVFIVLMAVLVLQIIKVGKDYFSIGKKTEQQTIIVKDNGKKLLKTEEKNKEQNKKQRSIDGALIFNSDNNSYPKMVTIENHSASRPQSGLDKANLVIEAPVEGGITRFLAIFADGGKVDKIGPIRSARPYFLDWAKEFDALYAHVGGSPQALKIIRENNDLHNLNQYFESKYFWRSSKRHRPHNVYSSSKLLNKAVESKKLKNVNFGVWKYKEENPAKTGKVVSDILIDFSTPINRVSWKYNKKNNDYIRYQAGKIHKTLKGEEIKAKNIAIQKTSVISVDKEDRKKIKTMGQGKFLVFLDGKVMEGTWKKPSLKKRTRFYDENNEEIKFNRGTTWIEVVDNETPIDY